MPPLLASPYALISASMITLNIIPQELKKNIRLLEIYLSLKRLSMIIFLIIFVFIGVYYGFYFYLRFHLDEVLSESETLSEDTGEYTKKLAEINSRLDFSESLQKENVKWVDFLQDFSTHVNKGITLDSLNASKNAGTLQISGKAKSRDNLLDFEKNLKSLPYLSEINIPLQTLLEKEDIKFSILIKLNVYEFVVK
jgi:hypothetical protein